MLHARNRRIPVTFSIFVGCAYLAGCAHLPPAATKDPKTLFSNACSPGKDVHGVQGSIWLRAKSTDESGQFPAAVDVKAPDTLRMEVTNLIGGTEAVISISGRSYKVEVPNKGPKGKGESKTLEDASGYWGGIPLRWATDLFLGRIPCPRAAVAEQSKMEVSSDGDLVINTPAGLEKDPERFTYHFRPWAGKLWPDSLRWERMGTVPVTVDFKFDDPEERTDSPRKWEAKSARGEVKVRWKDRQLLPS